MEVEHIEEWKGQDVVDSDGAKIGKLEDVLFERGSRDPVFGCVKTGLFGRHLTLVPLAGASLSRDHVRVAHDKDQVKDGPRLEDDGTLSTEGVSALSEHYGIEPAGEHGQGPLYETGGARAERLAAAEEAEARAAELEQLAERRASEAGDSERQAEEARKEAQRAEEERDRAQADAAQARSDAPG